MKRIMVSAALLLSGLLLLPGVSFADMEKAAELYRKSGLAKQLRDMGPTIQAGYRHNYDKGRDHSERDKMIAGEIGRLVREAFDPAVMQDKVVAGMATEIPPADMEQVLAWLNSPLGMKITAMEERAGTKEGMAETQEYIRNIKKEKLTPERIQLVRNLNGAMNVTETTIDITLAIQYALSMTTGKAKQDLSGEEVRLEFEAFQNNREQIGEMIGHQVHGSLLYTYQGLSDEELAEYIAFARSSAGIVYHQVTSSHMTRAITESCLLFAENVSQI